MTDKIREGIKLLEEELIRVRGVEVRLVQAIEYSKEELRHRDKQNDIEELLRDIKKNQRLEVEVGNEIELIKNYRNYQPGTKGKVLDVKSKEINIMLDVSNEIISIDKWDYFSYIRIR